MLITNVQVLAVERTCISILISIHFQTAILRAVLDILNRLLDLILELIELIVTQVVVRSRVLGNFLDVLVSVLCQTISLLELSQYLSIKVVCCGTVILTHGVFIVKFLAAVTFSLFLSFVNFDRFIYHVSNINLLPRIQWILLRCPQTFGILVQSIERVVSHQSAVVDRSISSGSI